MLWRKLIRDLWRQRWQTLPLLLVLGLGTAVFVACFVGYDSLGVSYRETQERTHLAEVTVDVTRVTGDEVRRIGALSGVAASDVQTVISVPAQVGAGGRSEARLISIPAYGDQVLNHVVVETGQYPAKAGEVLVEHHFAAYHDLQAGNMLRLETPTGTHTVQVAGVAVAAEYLWVSRNEYDLMPSPADFGVLFVPRPLMVEFGLTDADGGGNRLLYNLTPGADASAVLAAVKEALGADRVLKATARADLIGIKMLQDDIDGFAEVAVMLPLFFLAVVALILATVMSRQVDRERPLVGTMLALGMSRRNILLHYLGYGLVTGLLATGIGSLAGVALGNLFAALYAEELLIPFITLRVNGWVIAAGMVMGLAAAMLACLVPAVRAARLHPAEAMRPGPAARPPRQAAAGPGGGGSGRAPVWWRLALRNLRRQPLRSAGSTLGVVAALVLLIATAGMGDSVERMLAMILSEGPRYDLRVDLAAPVPAGELEAAVTEVDGVRSLQTALTLPVQLRNGALSEQTAAQVLPRENELLRVLATDGQELIAGDDQVLVSEPVARKLGLAVGDAVELNCAGRSVRRTVGGLIGTSLMEPVVLHGAQAAEALGFAGTANTALVAVETGATASVKEALQKLPGVMRVTDQAQLREQVNDLMGLAYLLIGVLFGCGAVLAGCVLVNTVTLNVVERQRELATMRADGHPMGSLIRLITMENLLTAAAGAIAGVPLGMVTMRYVITLYESTLFTMPYVVKPATLGLSLATVLGVMLLAQVPALCHVARLNLAEATRTRE
jgi:putative ABC transport system permease protein